MYFVGENAQNVSYTCTIGSGNVKREFNTEMLMHRTYPCLLTLCPTPPFLDPINYSASKARDIPLHAGRLQLGKPTSLLNGGTIEETLSPSSCRTLK